MTHARDEFVDAHVLQVPLCCLPAPACHGALGSNQAQGSELVGVVGLCARVPADVL